MTRSILPSRGPLLLPSVEDRLLADRVTASEGDITALDSRLTTAESDVSGLDTRLTTAEGDIDTLEGLVTVPFQSWTPTLTGYVAGTGATISARYRLFGGWVEAEFYWALGTSFTVVGTGTISLPVEADTTIFDSAVTQIGQGYVRDLGSATFLAGAALISSTTFRIGTWQTNFAAPYARFNSVNDTTPVPHTWAEGDYIHLWLKYLPA